MKSSETWMEWYRRYATDSAKAGSRQLKLYVSRNIELQQALQPYENLPELERGQKFDAIIVAKKAKWRLEDRIYGRRKTPPVRMNEGRGHRPETVKKLA